MNSTRIDDETSSRRRLNPVLASVPVSNALGDSNAVAVAAAAAGGGGGSGAAECSTVTTTIVATATATMTTKTTTATAGCKTSGGGGDNDNKTEQEATNNNKTTNTTTTDSAFRSISSTSSACSASSVSASAALSSAVAEAEREADAAPSDQEHEQDKKPAADEAAVGTTMAASVNEEGEDGTESENTDDEEPGDGSGLESIIDRDRKRRSCDDSSSSSSSDDQGESSSSRSCNGERRHHHHHHHHRPRKSARGNISSVASLARDIVTDRRSVVFVTGAGISVASGVRPFRGATGVWEQHIWTTATRTAFRKGPLDWYNSFFLKSLVLPDNVRPNDGHLALDRILGLFPSTVRLITQNVDGLHNTFASKFRSVQPIEAHGRLGLFKCLPLNADFDSDTDDDTDEDEDRPVHLGHRRKHRQKTEKTSKIMKSTGSRSVHCPYRQNASVPLDCIEPKSTRAALQAGTTTISHPPRCPHCGNVLAPQGMFKFNV